MKILTVGTGSFVELVFAFPFKIGMNTSGKTIYAKVKDTNPINNFRNFLRESQSKLSKLILLEFQIQCKADRIGIMYILESET